MRWIVPVVLVFSLPAACGARTPLEGDAGGLLLVTEGNRGPAKIPPVRTGPDAMADFPVCPPERPIVGSACFAPGSGCRYTDLSGTIICQAFACTLEEHWRSAPEGCR